MSSLARKALNGQKTIISELECDDLTVTTLNVNSLTISFLEVDDINITNNATIANDLTVTGGKTIVQDLDVEETLNAKDGLNAEEDITCDTDIIATGKLQGDTIEFNTSITGPGEIDIDGNVTANTFITDVRTNLNRSVGCFLQNNNFRTWASGANPGDTPLPIPLLEGNDSVYMRLEFTVLGDPQNSGNRLIMYFNNSVVPNNYSSRIRKDGNTVVDNTEQNVAAFCTFDAGSGNPIVGNGTITFNSVANNVDMLRCITWHGEYSSKRTGNGNSCNVYQMAGCFDQSGGIEFTDLVQITLDVSDNNHQGWYINYRIYDLR